MGESLSGESAAIRISAAMIVRDEAAHLPECLSGLAGLADEICVVDTGSVDDTAEIARAFGCRLAFFTWCDDFAAARNESLRLCRGEWIFVIDADERIAPPDRPRLRALTDAGPHCCYRFVTRNYTNEAHLSDFTPCAPGDAFARGFAGWHPSAKVRLFPNWVGARFEGRVHELVNQSLESRGIAIVDSAIPVHHYPLARPAEAVRHKREHYLRLGIEKRRERPDDPRAAAELGAQYMELGDYAAAAAAYRDAVRLDAEIAKKSGGAPNPLWLRDLGGALHLAGRPEEAEQALRIALKVDPESPEVWRNLGVVQAARNAWFEARDCFARAAALAPQDSEIRRHHAVALARTGEMDAATAEARAALQCNPLSSAAAEFFVDIMTQAGQREEARRFLEEWSAAIPGALMNAALARLRGDSN